MPLVSSNAGVNPMHPWRDLADLGAIPHDLTDASAVELVDSAGQPLGTGIFDRRDPLAVWRRFSHMEGAVFNEDYVAASMIEAFERRADEACQRLISSDADFLPGLVVELYQEVVLVRLETAAFAAMQAVVLEVLRETLNPAEIVWVDAHGVRTESGNNLKPRWIEIDELSYRVDLLQPEKSGFPLVLREQHALFGSLCGERKVLDLFAHSGAFALQAMQHGATESVAVHPDAAYSKAVGANAQRNGHRVEGVCAEVLAFLAEQAPGSFDAVAIDLPGRGEEAVLKSVFDRIAGGAVMAAYLPLQVGEMRQLDAMVGEAAAAAGREARVFARTTQPFDFPSLLNFPESQIIEGLILEVL